MEVPMTLVALFQFIATPYVVGAVASFVFEKFNIAADVEPRRKFMIFAIVTIALVLISQALLKYIPLQLVNDFDPIYAEIMTVLIALYSSQVTHSKYNKVQPPSILIPITDDEEEPIDEGELG